MPATIPMTDHVPRVRSVDGAMVHSAGDHVFGSFAWMTREHDLSEA